MLCSYCSQPVAPRAPKNGGQVACCERCRALQANLLILSQGDGVKQLRENMVRQNAGDHRRKSLATLEVQMLVFFDEEMQPDGFELTLPLRKLLVQWRRGGKAKVFVTEEKSLSYWNHYELKSAPPFDLGLIQQAFVDASGNLRPEIRGWVRAGLASL